MIAGCERGAIPLAMDCRISMIGFRMKYVALENQDTWTVGMTAIVLLSP